MGIPTEPIGSIPRPGYLLEAMTGHGEGGVDDLALAEAVDRAVAETIAAMEATGSPVITDGEQSKPSFVTYPIAGLETLAPDGVGVIGCQDDGDCTAAGAGTCVQVNDNTGNCQGFAPNPRVCCRANSPKGGIHAAWATTCSGGAMTVSRARRACSTARTAWEPTWAFACPSRATA